MARDGLKGFEKFLQNKNVLKVFIQRRRSSSSHIEVQSNLNVPGLWLKLVWIAIMFKTPNNSFHKRLNIKDEKGFSLHSIKLKEKK